jgi:hypothetical protein
MTNRDQEELATLCEVFLDHLSTGSIILGVKERQINIKGIELGRYRESCRAGDRIRHNLI